MTVKIKYYFKSDGTFDKIWENENGQIHREDGPAVEYANGSVSWYNQGDNHRDDGPAIVHSYGRHLYYFNHIFYSKEEYWEKIEKMKKEREEDRNKNK